MNLIRVTSEEAFEPTGFPGYDIQMLAYPEEVTFINSRVAEGGHAADRHIHDADQVYYVAEGQMQLELGTTRYHVEPNSLVFIPAGLPHRNWNEGPGTEFHFEIIVPSSRPGRPMLTLVDEATPARTADGQEGYVARADPPTAEPVTLQRLTHSSAGRQSIAVGVCDEGPASPIIGMHTHKFDQFYYVLSGSLSVLVAGDHHDVGERTLVMLPSGVPHCSVNRSGGPVRYLVIEVPGREADD
jgi:mannose-6-phosphate isomerase-like protein (cupin superfamily)